MATGARGKGRPKLTETAEIDRAIRDAALQVLLEHGEAATMHAVAQAAGISRKSLYARHPNKAELFLEVISELLQGSKSLEYDTSGSPADRLFHYIQAALDVVSRPQSLALQRLLTIDPVYISVLRSQMLEASHRLLLEPLQELLHEAKQNGDLVIDDVEATSHVVIRMIFTELTISEHYSNRSREQGTRDDYATFITKIILRGLAPR